MTAYDHPAPPQRAEHRALLARMQEMVGLEPTALRAHLTPSAGDMLSAVEAGGHGFGLRLRPFNAPIDTLFPALSKGQPLLTADQNGDPLLLLNVRGNRFRTENSAGQTTWLDRAQLAQMLGLKHAGADHRWLTVDNAKALSVPLSTQASHWKNALALLQGEGENLWAIVLYALGVGLFSLVLPLTVQTLVNTVAFGQLIQPLVVLTLLLTVALTFVGAFRAAQAWVVEVVQRRLFMRLVSDLSERLPRMRIDAFEKNHGPELMNRFFDIFVAQKAVASLLVGGIESLLVVGVGLTILALYHPILLGFGLVLLLSIAFVLGVLGRGATRSTIQESKSKYALAAWLEEMARHLFLLKAPSGRRYAQGRLDQLAATWLRQRSTHFRVYYRQLLGGLALQALAHAALLSLGGWLVMERTLTIGQLVAAELIVTAVVASLSKLTGKLESVYDLVASADKLSVLLTLPIEENEGREGIAPLTAAGAVELLGVSSPDGHLKELYLSVEAKSSSAILGPRPAIRALSDMLYGLRIPRDGAIRLGGQDIRDIHLDALRTQLTVIRGAENLPGTIRENLQAARADVGATELWQALAAVGLDQRIRDLPQGLSTSLLPSAAPLDAVEALKLTLARARVSPAQILILDGVIEALPEIERAPLLERLGADRTLVILTSEPSVAALCPALERVVDGQIQSFTPGELQ